MKIRGAKMGTALIFPVVQSRAAFRFLFMTHERVIEYLTQEQQIVQDPSQVGIRNLKDTIFLFQTGQNNWSF